MLAALLLLPARLLPAQHISFYHLNTTNGLSDNLVHSVVRDQQGLLWIGTGEGLNLFDGYAVQRFYKEDYPALGTNQVFGLLCDSLNRIWVRNDQGKVSMVDQERRFIHVPVMADGAEVSINFMRQTRAHGLILIAGARLFQLSGGMEPSFKRMVWKEDTALQHRFNQVVTNDRDILLLTGDNRLCVFDAGHLNVLGIFTINNIVGAAWINDAEVLVTTGQNQQLLRFNIRTGKVIRDYGSLIDQNGEPIRGYLRNIRKMEDGRYIMTSGYGGVYTLDLSRDKLLRFQHDPLDERSISANNTYILQTDTAGYVFVSTRSAGLNYFNIRYSPATSKEAFQETGTGKIFHGFVNTITQHPSGNFWFGTQSSIIEWNRAKNIVRFYSPGEANGNSLAGIEEVRAIYFDKDDRLWAGLNRYGITVLDRQRNFIERFYPGHPDTTRRIAGNFITRIVKGPGEQLWVATTNGLSIIDPQKMQTIPLRNWPGLDSMATKYCYNIWFRNSGEVWIATSTGAYRYQFASGKLRRFDRGNGLPGNTTICFTEDKVGQIYIGTSSGLAIVQQDSVVAAYRRGNELRSDRCQGFINDRNGNIWIANDNAIVCYRPTEKTFTSYDAGYGLNESGTRLLSFCEAADGEQLWGSDEGLSSFYPEQLEQIRFPLGVRISQVYTGGRLLPYLPTNTLRLPYLNNSVQFAFAATDLFGSRTLQFQYKLEGADADWVPAQGPQLVSYSHLRPGNYTFRVRVSRDGKRWISEDHVVSLRIMAPWWQSLIFRIGVALFVISIVYYIIRSRNRKIAAQQEQLETEQAINYFANSIHEQQTTDDILWDVTRNCISRLNFADCVIYIKDKNRDVLVQKAAWGPKNEGDAQGQEKILNPIELPVGKGIVGAVAASMKGEIVNDTSADPRYVVDDERRLSEIAVPIVFDGKLIGVIDSEHPKKNFFQQHHLSVLTAIASLCANKLLRQEAEKARQQAQLELLDHQRKMAEVQLKSLRLQMNPHFLFNSLNSIQQIILSGNEAGAVRYLSRFSRLLRLVLQHSDQEKILLREEIETLRLYLELEALRFDDSFEYTVSADGISDPDEIRIPTLLVQPFVENAIWHGLLHSTTGKRQLVVRFSEDRNDNLVCVVEDNGIGRKAAAEKGGQDVHTSKGLSVAADRIRTFNEQHNRNSSFTIEDLYTEKGEACGTRVTLILPLTKDNI